MALGVAILGLAVRRAGPAPRATSCSPARPSRATPCAARAWRTGAPPSSTSTPPGPGRSTPTRPCGSTTTSTAPTRSTSGSARCRSPGRRPAATPAWRRSSGGSASARPTPTWPAATRSTPCSSTWRTRASRRPSGRPPRSPCPEARPGRSRSSTRRSAGPCALGRPLDVGRKTPGRWQLAATSASRAAPGVSAVRRPAPWSSAARHRLTPEAVEAVGAAGQELGSRAEAAIPRSSQAAYRQVARQFTGSVGAWSARAPTGDDLRFE